MLLREFRYLLGPQGTDAVASTTGTKQIQRRDFLPFKTAGIICPGISHWAWLFWTLLVGMSVMVSNRSMPENLSLERTDASHKSPGSVPLLPARSLMHLPGPAPHLANLRLSTLCLYHVCDQVSGYFWNAGRGFYLAKTPLVFCWNDSQLYNFATTHPKLKCFFRAGRFRCAHL